MGSGSQGLLGSPGENLESAGEIMKEKPLKIGSTRYAVEEAIRLSREPGSWEAKARTSQVASWAEILRGRTVDRKRV